MPAETIHGDNTPIDVRVAWGQSSEYVQVASLHDKGFDAMLVIVNGWLEAANMPTIDKMELQKGLAGTNFEGAVACFDGWHATLAERAAVNRLIAVLRRARDQAFGRDE